MYDKISSFAPTSLIHTHLQCHAYIYILFQSFHSFLYNWWVALALASLSVFYKCFFFLLTLFGLPLIILSLHNYIHIVLFAVASIYIMHLLYSCFSLFFDCLKVFCSICPSLVLFQFLLFHLASGLCNSNPLSMESILISILPSCFFTYNLSTSYHRCKALCSVINLFIFWSSLYPLSSLRRTWIFYIWNCLPFYSFG